jgi:phage tail sheath protein FI
MPTYLWPGVYVEEIPSASKPIEGVGTAVAAFVGLTPGGPVNSPTLIANWTQFATTFGDMRAPDNGPFMTGAYLAHAVFGFFQNGGSLCWVVRVGGGATNAPPPEVALPSASDATIEAFRIVALDPAQGETKVELQEEPPAAGEPSKEGDGDGGQTQGEGATPEPREPSYRLVVTAGGEREEHTGLSLKRGRGFIATKVNGASKLIKIEEPGGQLSAPEGAPAPGTYTLVPPAIPTAAIGAGDLEGDVAARTGMGSLAAIDEITMLCAPDVMTLDGGMNQILDLQGKMIAHCELANDRMTILDAPAGMSPAQVLDWRMVTAGYDSKFATLYYPWLKVMDPLTKEPIAVPPCGHMAGVWARTDSTRGVHKAPANEVVRGAIDVDFQVTKDEQGLLNPKSVNCIRKFPGRGIRIWGARTLSNDPEWRYLNVRRLFNYVCESIMEGTQWAVFEPNDERLWMQLRIAASNFLTRTWRDGALFGATPAEAFFVKCDAETNPPDVIEAGQVVIEIGIAPVKPAEFVIFRISQTTAGAADVGA